ncbi:MAG: M14 family zinc carboxypeptidase, partial [Sphingomonadales bacterium]
MNYRGLLIFALLLLAFPFAIAAESAESYDDFRIEGLAYDAAVPTPEAVLGHQLGKAPVRHHKLIEYIQRVAEASPRMTVETIGYTHERRPILFVVVTSPENHARLAEIRAAHLAISEPGSGKVPEAGMPVVTWLNYGVHGAEASGMDAALP